MTKVRGPKRRKPEAWYCIIRNLMQTGQVVLRVKVKRQRCEVGKSFAVTQYDSEENALNAAQAWRDAVLALVPPMTPLQLRNQPSKSNKSGIAGVHLVHKRGGDYWVTNTDESNAEKKIYFSVKMHGAEQAKALAIDARKKFIQTIEASLNVGTQTSVAIAQRDCGSPPKKLGAAKRETIVDATVKAAFLRRLRDAGLMDEPTPPVQRRHYVSKRAAVWEAFMRFPDGTRKSRRFSVSCHGEAKAKQMAEAAYVRLLAESNAQQRGNSPSLCKQRFADKLAEYPNEVLDVAMERLNLKFDVALARLLGFAPPVISKLRHNNLPLRSTILVSILEATNLHIRDLHQLTMNKHRAVA